MDVLDLLGTIEPHTTTISDFQVVSFVWSATKVLRLLIND